MSLAKISNTSIIISLLRHFYKSYDQLEQRASYIYQDSQIHRLTKEFWEKIKICFRYSFLGRITEVKQTIPAILDNSRVLQYLINFYKKCRDSIIRYSGSSLATSAPKDVKRELYLLPVRTISIILVTSILVNVLLSILLHKQIGLWGWMMRALFLFAGASGLFCQLDWPTLKGSSLFLRKLRRD